MPARFLRAGLLATLAAVSAGCTYVDLTQARGPCWGEAGGWCGFTREMAAESWEYAQLAQNTYDDDDDFAVLPAGIELRANSGNDAKGYAYAVYDRMDGAVLKERIIAYRGTEAGLTDWVNGNLSDEQNRRGLQTYQEVRRDLDEEFGGYWKDVPITVTGHSLGGGIALNVSLRYPGVNAYVFNESPRYAIPMEPAPARRLSINERGDPLGRVRDVGTLPALDSLVLNCRPGGALGKDHSIRKLAECLTWIAARSSAVARKSVEENGIEAPPIERMYGFSRGTGRVAGTGETATN